MPVQKGGGGLGRSTGVVSSKNKRLRCVSDSAAPQFWGPWAYLSAFAALLAFKVVKQALRRVAQLARRTGC